VLARIHARAGDMAVAARTCRHAVSLLRQTRQTRVPAAPAAAAAGPAGEAVRPASGEGAVLGDAAEGAAWLLLAEDMLDAGMLQAADAALAEARDALVQLPSPDLLCLVRFPLSVCALCV
jgi:hypothetical protein